ncbi:MAG: hypothetical protein ACKO9B_11265 [Planctomycetota bacterium]
MPVVLLAMCATGCGSARLPEPAVPSLDGQIAAVRAGRATTITLRAPVESPAAWARLGGLPGLRELVVERGRADDAAAAILATLPDLERLVLRESPVGDEGLARLAALPRLRDLNLPQSAATARGVELLAAGPAGQSLRMLRLGGADLAGADVARAVARLVGLRSLHLIDVPIGDEGLASLAEMPGLWSLYLDGAGVSEGAWGRYFERRPDVHVHVDQVHHDRDPRSPH